MANNPLVANMWPIKTFTPSQRSTRRPTLLLKLYRFVQSQMGGHPS